MKVLGDVISNAVVAMPMKVAETRNRIASVFITAAEYACYLRTSNMHARYLPLCPPVPGRGDLPLFDCGAKSANTIRKCPTYST